MSWLDKVQEVVESMLLHQMLLSQSNPQKEVLLIIEKAMDMNQLVKTFTLRLKTAFTVSIYSVLSLCVINKYGFSWD